MTGDAGAVDKPLVPCLANIYRLLLIQGVLLMLDMSS